MECKDAITPTHSLWSILDRVSDGVICCAELGTITYLNQAGARTLECTAHGAVGKQLKQYFPAAAELLAGVSNPGARPLQAIGAYGNLISLTGTLGYLPAENENCFCITFSKSQPLLSASADSARLVAIVESSDDAIIGKRLDGTITSWNKGAERIFGYTAEEVVGQHISKLIPPGHENEEPGIQDRLRAGERVDHFETVRLARNGKLIDVSLTISPIRDMAGKIIGASKIARDISERKLAAAAREEIEKRMRLAIEAAKIGIWDWNLKTQNVSWSDRFANLFGVEELSGTFEIFQTCLHPDDRGLARQRMLEAPQTRTAYRDEYRVVWTDGSIHWIEARGDTIYDADGTPMGVTGTIIDVTERKAAEAAVTAAEQRLQMAADAAEIGFWDWDLKAKTMTRLPMQAQLKGADEVQTSSKPESVNIHPDDREVTQLKLREALNSDKEYVNEFRTIWSDGSVRWLEGRGRAYYDGSNRDRRMLGVVVDITERKNAEEVKRLRDAELAHLSRISTMGNMAAALAHELNQPLGAILNYAGVCMTLLNSIPLPVDKFRMALEEVMGETRRAGAIISRIQSFVSKQTPKSALIDLNDLVQKSVMLLDFELRHLSIRPVINLCLDLPKVRADVIQIQQVLVNLIYNAFQAMNECPVLAKHLTLETRCISPTVAQISVIDSGPGISPENLRRLFQPFFTTKSQGMGMGLNISRSIVENHGGHLSATLNPTVGMTFNFTLPIETGTQ